MPSRSRRITDATFEAETAREPYRPRSRVWALAVGLDKCELMIRRIPLLVIKRKQRHSLFNWNLDLDDNDYLLLLLIILILDGLANTATRQHLKRERIVITDRQMIIGLTFLMHLQHAG